METQKNMLKVLSQNYQDAENKVSTLIKAFNESAQKSGTASTETKELAIRLENAKTEAAEAKTKMEEYADKVNKAGKESDDAEEKVGKLANGLKTGLPAAAKVGGAALAVVGAAVISLTAASVENYAEYEQLVGGVDTLFKKSSDTVQQYAANAYKTAGLSANEYIETVTSFSASLLQSLDGDTAAAAKAADQAITDMSDNANKMGTSMESIQNAYQGFAKQNYTMLDNLKLGYGGTKEEMQRLLTDAEKLSGKKFDLSSYADIVEAIHVVQTEMGITGTTANEAATTIQGSMSMAKSAWKNLVTGMADKDADLDTLINNFVDSVVVVGQNVVPVAETALGGITTLVEKLAPTIEEKLPGLVESLLPKITSAATSLLTSVANAIPSLLTTAVNELPAILEAGLQIILALANGISASLPELTPTIVNVVLELVNVLVSPENLGNIIDAALQLILALAGGLIDSIPVILEKAPEIIQGLVDGIVQNIDKIIDAAILLIVTIANTLIEPDMIATILNAAVDIIAALVKGFAESGTTLIESGTEAITNLLTGIGNMFTNLKEKGGEAIDKFAEGIKEKWEEAKTWGKDLVDNFIAGIKEKWANLTAAVSDTAQIVKDFLGFSEPDKGPLSNFHTYAPDMMDLFAEGIEKNSDKVLEKVEKLAEKIKEKFNEIQSYFQTTSDIAELEYELWEMTEGIDASEAEKAAKRIELLNKQLNDQKEVVEASNIAYQEMVKLYGEGSAEAMEYKKQLLEEQVEYQKLTGELNETNETYKELTKSQRTWATVAIDAVKSVANAISESTQTADAAVAEQQEKSNRNLSDSIGELVNLFKSGKAKTNISNARDLRSVSYG